MEKQNNNGSYFSRFIANGKDLIALLRDGVLLVIAVLLIGWPQTINSILVKAGFEEGSFAGMKWKAQLTQTDETLVKAQAAIVDLRDQNERLNTELSRVKSQIDNTEVKEDIAKLEKINENLVASSAKVQAAVKATTSANAPFVQKIRTSTGEIITWGVVYGSDRTLDLAKHETQIIAPKLGLTTAAIYYRQGTYRSVATTTDRLHAEQLLNKAKERRKDSYIVNMSAWCPNITEKNGYFECSSL